MNEELIKALLKAKLMLFDYSAGFLPQKAQSRLNNLRYNILKAVYEVSGEYVGHSQADKTENKVNQISID